MLTPQIICFRTSVFLSSSIVRTNNHDFITCDLDSDVAMETAASAKLENYMVYSRFCFVKPKWCLAIER